MWSGWRARVRCHCKMHGCCVLWHAWRLRLRFAWQYFRSISKLAGRFFVAGPTLSNFFSLKWTWLALQWHHAGRLISSSLWKIKMPGLEETANISLMRWRPSRSTRLTFDWLTTEGEFLSLVSGRMRLARNAQCPNLSQSERRKQGCRNVLMEHQQDKFKAGEGFASQMTLILFSQFYALPFSFNPLRKKMLPGRGESSVRLGSSWEVMMRQRWRLVQARSFATFRSKERAFSCCSKAGVLAAFGIPLLGWFIQWFVMFFSNCYLALLDWIHLSLRNGVAAMLPVLLRWFCAYPKAICLAL